MKMIIEMLNQIGGIGVIFTVIGACIKYNSKKGWKCRKNASNREKFLFLFFKMLIATIIATIIFICIRYINIELLRTSFYTNSFDKLVLLIITILVCILILQNEWRNEEKIAIKYFQRPYALFAVYVIPVVLANTLFFRYIVNCKLIDMLCFICTIVFFVVIIIFLDGKKEYGYKYVTIYLEGKDEIQNLDINSIQKKGKWIIGQSEDKKIEYRIRIQNIRRVEYMNEKKNRNQNL